MLTSNSRDPKRITIRVLRAEDLGFNLPENKKKKTTKKWRVVFMGANKKKASEIVEAANGNPEWNCEVNMKLSSNRHEPICLLVIDSEEHHVGQVVIPLTKIQAKPTDGDPTAPWRISCERLEPTKKTSDPMGCLYYWSWVDEYHPDSTMVGPGDHYKSTGSIKGMSLLSRSKQDLKSLFHKGSKQSGLDMTGEKKSRGHFWSRGSKKKAEKAKAGALVSSNGRPTQSLCDITRIFEGEANYVVHDIGLEDDRGLGSDDDGDFIGGGTQLREHLPDYGRPRSITVAAMLGNSGGDHIHAHQRSKSFGALNQFAEAVIDSATLGTAVKANTWGKHTAGTDGVTPLLTVHPDHGSVSGGYTVELGGANIAASHNDVICVLVNGLTLTSECVQFHATDHLTVHMPPMSSPCRCYIEVETKSRGRVRCPQPFTYSVEPYYPGIGSKAAHRSSSFDTPKRPTVKKTDSGIGTLGRRFMVGSMHELSGSPASSTGGRYQQRGGHSRQPSDASYNGGVSDWDLRTQMGNYSRQERKLSAKAKATKKTSLSKRDLMEDNEKLLEENDELMARLHEATKRLSLARDQCTTLQSQLQTRERDVERLSTSLCRLRFRLLEDGHVKYLERDPN